MRAQYIMAEGFLMVQRVAVQILRELEVDRERVHGRQHGATRGEQKHGVTSAMLHTE